MKIDKNIFQTLVVRGGVAVLNMGIVFLTLNILGAGARGKISLFLTDIMLITMITNVLGGSAISYHVSKTSIKPLIKWATLWVFLVSLLMGGGLSVIHQEFLQNHLFPISFLIGLITMNQMILIGKEKIKEYNIVFVLDPLFKILVLMIGFYVIKNHSLEIFLIALYVSLISSFFVSSFFVFKLIKKDVSEYKFTFKEILKYGIGTEISSFLQFFNYRLLFYVVFYQFGDVELGWFSVGVSMAESLWIISRSIAVNQYSKIVNTTNKLEQRVVTDKSARLSSILTLAAIVVMLLIPEEIFRIIIKKDYSEIQKIIWFLCPGILLISISNVWGHYFSGIGRYHVNNLKSVIGFVSMVVSAFFLIPYFNLIGVVLAMVIGYLGSSLTLLLFYLKDKNVDL